jgi:hypothetical protein
MMKKPLIKEGYIEIKNIKSRMNKEIISRFFLIKLALGVLLRASQHAALINERFAASQE